MQLPEALTTYLLAQSALTNIIGSRLTPEHGEQSDDPRGIKVPSVLYHIDLIPTPEAEAMNEATGLIDAAVEFTAVGESYTQVFEIADILRILLEIFKGLMGGTSGLQIETLRWDSTRGGYTPDIDLYTAEVTFFIQYIPA